MDETPSLSVQGKGADSRLRGKEDVRHRTGRRDKDSGRQAGRAGNAARRSAAGVVAAAILLATPAAADDLPASADPGTLAVGELCLAEATRQERELDIPRGLLTAIALTESGRFDRTAGALRAWPWTLNVAGDGLYFDTREEARAAAARALASGIRQVDIGCMQVSMAWHATGFETVTEALEPVDNVAYGARYLRGLYDRHGDWSEAVRRYHSGDPDRGEAYLRRVIDLWQGDDAPEAGGTGRVVAADRRDSPHHKAADRLRTGDFEGARTAYSGILGRNPDDRTALAGFAMALENLDRPRAALEAWRSFLMREPGSQTAADRVQDLLGMLPAPEAEVLLAEMVAAAPANARLLDALARYKLAAGDAEGGTALLLRAAASAPDDPRLIFNAAVMLDRMAQRRAAVQAYEAFLLAQNRAPVVDAASTAQARARLSWLRAALARN